MTHPSQTHPDPARLRAYALGRLGAVEAAALETHVAACAACCAHLKNAPDDTFIGRLRVGGGGAGGETVGAGLAGAGAAAADTLDLPAGLIDHPTYQIIRLLGAGGMGVVYHAVHRLMERDVAVKVINPALVTHPAALDRFRQEMKAAARLSHPNVVAAHDAGQAGDAHYLVMEYVDGVSLDRLVAKKGPLPLAQACHFVRQAALGLSHAHEKGMVHRDVKPQNLMVSRKGQVKVLDFGLARVAEEAHAGNRRPLTAFGTVMGTPDYVAPEQVSDARTVDGRADAYALGCTLYFLLAGRPPFPDGNALEKVLAHVDRASTPLRQLRPEVPHDLALIVDRMMAKSPAARHQTPSETAQALAPFVQRARHKPRPYVPPAAIPPVLMPVRQPTPPPPPAETPPSPPPRLAGGGQPSRIAALLIAGGAVLAVLILVGALTIVPALVVGAGKTPPAGGKVEPVEKPPDTRGK